MGSLNNKAAYYREERIFMGEMRPEQGIDRRF
jgi:hypothetical protein